MICFGPGGATSSIVLNLLFNLDSSKRLEERKIPKPRKCLLVDNNRKQLELAEEFLLPFSQDLKIQYIFSNRSEDNDKLVNVSTPGSLIINPTALGKDLPGSPLSDDVLFSTQSVIWDLNYRGDLSFLKQAESKKNKLELHIYDGWWCFIHGWTQSLQLCLQIDFSLEKFEQLVQIAEDIRCS